MLSDPLASSAEGCSEVGSSGAAVGLDGTAGNRPDTVQQVVGERNEQSGALFSAAAEAWVLAAQPPRNAMRAAPVMPKII